MGEALNRDIKSPTIKPCFFAWWSVCIITFTDYVGIRFVVAGGELSLASCVDDHVED